MSSAWPICGARGTNFLPAQNGFDNLTRHSMTTQKKLARENKFVGAFLPWLVAIAGLLLYLTTLNHWFSVGNITQAALMSKDFPGIELYAPVYFLATYPLHLIAGPLIPLSLNIFSAVCGAI